MEIGRFLFLVIFSDVHAYDKSYLTGKVEETHEYTSI